MRASLVSATSLLALLLLGQVPACATPAATPAATPGDAGASPSTEFDNATVGSLVTDVDSIALSRTLSGSMGASSMGPSNPGITLGVSATSMGLTAPGFPPSNDSIGNSFVRNRGAILPAASSIGDRGANGLHGWHGSSNSVFVESAKSFWLNGSSNSPGGSGSPAISDTYAPAVRGVPASATVASTTLGRSYTPLSRTAALLRGDGGFSNDDAGLANQAVSSVFARRRGAPLASNGAAGTAADELGGPAHSRIAFGTVGYGKLLTVYQRLANAGTGGANNRADQTVESFSTAAPTTPSLSSALAVPSLSPTGSQVVMPITASTAQSTAVLNSSMTIFTDQSAALSGTGDTVTYTLAGFAVAAPASAPEPASLAMLGAGLAGMVSFLRRRQRMVCR